MGEEFKITFVMPKEEAKAIAENEEFCATLENDEVEALNNALVNNADGIAFNKRNDLEDKKQKLAEAIDTFQEALAGIRDSL